MLLEPNPERRRSRLPLLASAGLHLLVLGFLLYRPPADFIKAQPSLRGNRGRGDVMALATAGISSPVATPGDAEKQRLAPPSKSRRKTTAPNARAQAAAAEKDLMPGMPGYILGSLADGFAGNHDVRAAVSIVAPDPPIARHKLPEWIRGDVIVEVTIDEQGNVIGTRVLQTVGFGLDQIIVETLRQWRYIPAKVDGVAVASREDVHFHFPS